MVIRGHRRRSPGSRSCVSVDSPDSGAPSARGTVRRVKALALLGLGAAAAGDRCDRRGGRPGRRRGRAGCLPRQPAAGGDRAPRLHARRRVGRNSALGRSAREGRARHVPRRAVHRCVPDRRRRARAWRGRAHRGGASTGDRRRHLHRPARGHPVSRCRVPRPPPRERPGALPHRTAERDGGGVGCVQDPAHGANRRRLAPLGAGAGLRRRRDLALVAERRRRSRSPDVPTTSRRARR